MPHAVLRINNMAGVTVTDFFISFPEDLKIRIMAMIMSTSGPTSTEINNHVTLDGANGDGILLHTLLNWIESSGWSLIHVAETAVSQYSTASTYTFARTPRMGMGGGGAFAGSYSGNLSGWQAPNQIQDGHGVTFKPGHPQGSLG